MQIRTVQNLPQKKVLLAHCHLKCTRILSDKEQIQIKDCKQILGQPEDPTHFKSLKCDHGGHSFDCLPAITKIKTQRHIARN